MNPSSDMEAAMSAGSGATGSDGSQTLPPTWYEAVAALVASRLALIQLECKSAVKGNARRVGLLLAMVGCVFFAWLLLIAGGIQLVATALQWPWSWVAIALAVIHLILAFVLVQLAKISGTPTFPHTRAEFQKDREWIEQLKKTKKSNG